MYTFDQENNRQYPEVRHGRYAGKACMHPAEKRSLRLVNAHLQGPIMPSPNVSD